MSTFTSTASTPLSIYFFNFDTQLNYFHGKSLKAQEAEVSSFRTGEIGTLPICCPAHNL